MSMDNLKELKVAV